MPRNKDEDKDEREEAPDADTPAPSAQKTHPERVPEVDEETGEPGAEHDDYDEEEKAKREEEHKGTSRPEEEY